MDVKEQLCQTVDDDAERERQRYITPGSGQAMTYQQKAAEVSNYLAATDPNPVDYPMLSAEVGITSETLSGVAQIVNGAYTQWQTIGAAIEAVRLSGKVAIKTANSIEAAWAAAAAVVWP